MNCEQARNQDLVEKYVTGQLPEPEMSVFEEHYFGCDDCLAAVQLGQSIVNGAKETAVQSKPKVIAMPGRNSAQRPRWMYALAAAAGLAIVALIGWRSLSSASKPAPGQAVAQAQPVTPEASAATTPSQPATAPEPQLIASNVDLGAIDALGYRSSVLRGSAEDNSQRFQRAMDAYVKRDYRTAATSLAAIPVAVPGSGKPEEHVTDAGIQLYLGISQLMQNQNTDAVRSLTRARNYGDTPYIENAGFYLSKGLIRQKRYAEASAELQRVIALNGDRQADAKHLLDQLNQLRAR